MLSHPQASLPRLGITGAGPFNCNQLDSLVQTLFTKR